MNILHKLSQDDIEAVAGEKLARNIVLAREGKLTVQERRRWNLWKNFQRVVKK